MLGGQQRITSFVRFITDIFAIKNENDMQQYFSSLAVDKQELILNSEILVYECEGMESEIKKWFRTIDIAVHLQNYLIHRNVDFFFEVLWLEQHNCCKSIFLSN